MKISEDVLLVQKQVRARTKSTERQHRTGTADMFGPETLVDPRGGHATPEDVDSFWLRYLGSGERRVGLVEFAGILESTDWFPGDLQTSLVRLINAGLVRNVDAKGRRPKRPLHFEATDGERLQLLDKQT